MSKATEDKGKKYFEEGKVSVLKVTSLSAQFLVRGSSAYTVTFKAAFWECTCPARVLDCAHIYAVKLWVAEGNQSDTLLERLKSPSFGP